MLLVIALVTVVRAQFHHPSQFRSQAVVNSGFIPSIQEDDDKIDDSTPSAAINYRQPAPSYEYEEEEEERPTTPNQIRRQQQQYPIRTQQSQSQQTRQPGPPPSKNRFEDELETEEPDRLALALEKSTFQCEGRTGYVREYFYF